MNASDPSTWAPLGVSILAFLTAIWAAFSSHRSATASIRSADAADRSAHAAEAVARNDDDRRQEELEHKRVLKLRQLSADLTVEHSKGIGSNGQPTRALLIHNRGHARATDVDLSIDLVPDDANRRLPRLVKDAASYTIEPESFVRLPLSSSMGTASRILVTLHWVDPMGAHNQTVEVNLH